MKPTPRPKLSATTEEVVLIQWGGKLPPSKSNTENDIDLGYLRTFRPFDVTPPGRFAHSLDVSPPTVDVSPPDFSAPLVTFATRYSVS